jgi:hypothetical protein
VNQIYQQAPPQMNGNDDSIGGNVGIQQQQQPRQNPQLAHILQQVHGNVNPRNAVNNKGPNIQGAPNAPIMNNAGGVVNMVMSMASNNVTNNNNNAVNSMQGRERASSHPHFFLSFILTQPSNSNFYL